MSTSNFKPADIIAARKKFPEDNLLQAKLVAGSVRSNIKAGEKVAKNKGKVYYIPLEFKDVTGAYRPLNFEFSMQLLAGNAKKNQYKNENSSSNFVNLLFTKLRKEDLEKSDYLPEQHSNFLKANAEFIEALDIILNEYQREAEMIAQYKGAKDVMPKPSNPLIRTLKQTHREAKSTDSGADADNKVPLERPLYRIKLNARPDGTIGTENKNGRADTVFDWAKYRDAKEKAKAEGKVAKKVPARLKTSRGTYVELNLDNVHNFITYMSMVTGKIRFDCINISTQGISLKAYIQELMVLHHKPRAFEGISEESLEEMMAVRKNNDDNDEPEIADEEPKTKSKPPAKAAAVFGDDEPDANGLDDPDENDGVSSEPDVEAETPKPKAAPTPAPIQTKPKKGKAT